ncbi:MAG: hypothetical protein ACRC6H_06365 [Culicoidibacterales bacterium]
MRNKKIISLLVLHGNVVVAKKDKKTQQIFDELQIDKRKLHDRVRVGNSREERTKKDYSAYIYEATVEQREQLKKQYGIKLCRIR